MLSISEYANEVKRPFDRHRDMKNGQWKLETETFKLAPFELQTRIAPPQMQPPPPPAKKIPFRAVLLHPKLSESESEGGGGVTHAH